MRIRFTGDQAVVIPAWNTAVQPGATISVSETIYHELITRDDFEAPVKSKTSKTSETVSCDDPINQSTEVDDLNGT